MHSVIQNLDRRKSGHIISTTSQNGTIFNEPIKKQKVSSRVDSQTTHSPTGGHVRILNEVLPDYRQVRARVDHDNTAHRAGGGNAVLSHSPLQWAPGSRTDYGQFRRWEEQELSEDETTPVRPKNSLRKVHTDPAPFGEPKPGSSSGFSEHNGLRKGSSSPLLVDDGRSSRERRTLSQNSPAGTSAPSRLSPPRGAFRGLHSLAETDSEF
eukprot:TRINITY_DN8783_c0_g1_i1.p1 TRINITY_DN8783_c0_g1~~TRINITY_DN8783_c0_g1_i1.p1  ORF type:complete len:217 (+),score=10.54 TRINITY_DN8783_c0_g1_i1:22-651(+)